MEDRIVFDAEPLVAYLANEPGAGVVQEYLDRLWDDEFDAYISPVQLTEVQYIATRIDEGARVDQFLSTLQENGVRIVPCEQSFPVATTYKLDDHSLGDSFALATATVTGCPLLVGADEDFDEADERYDIVRFRDQPA